MITGLNKQIFYSGESYTFTCRMNDSDIEVSIKAPSPGQYTLVLNPISKTTAWNRREPFTISNSWNLQVENVIVLPNKELSELAEFLLSDTKISKIQDELDIDISKYNSLLEVKKDFFKKEISYQNFLSVLRKCWYKFKVNDKKQLFLDITAFRFEKSRTGIQKVVRSYLEYLLKLEHKDWEIIPVYGDWNWGYIKAENWTSQYLNIERDNIWEEPICPKKGDVFFGLNLELHTTPNLESFLLEMKDIGVKIKFLVHDILPVTNPHWFEWDNSSWFKKWIDTVSKFSGVICVSKYTCQMFKNWMIENKKDIDNFTLETNYLGSDLEGSVPNYGMPENNILSKLNDSINFLMIGTIEPRKGHLDALVHFEKVAHKNKNIKLIIVGKLGWGYQSFVNKLQKSIFFGNQIFFIDTPSDEYLFNIFNQTHCLIANSYDEGFGLPLVEAANRNIPVLARDITVFREVLDSAHFYTDLYTGLNSWLQSFENKSVMFPKYKPITWQESSKKLFLLLTK